MNETRDLLVEWGARLSVLGLSPGTSGNLSMREGERVLMTPTGASLGELRRDELSELDLDGNLLGGPPPSKEYPFHRAFYRRAEKARAVVHLHSSHATAQACQAPWSERSALPPLTPYLVMRVGQTPMIPYAAPGSAAQAEVIEQMPFPFTSVLLQNHGLVTSGSTMEEAVARAIEIEECSKLLALLGEREPRLLTAGQVAELVERYGAPWDTADVDWPKVGM